MGREGEEGTDAATWPGKVGNKLRELEFIWAERASGMAQGQPLEGLMALLQDQQKRASSLFCTSLVLR